MRVGRGQPPFQQAVRACVAALAALLLLTAAEKLLDFTQFQATMVAHEVVPAGAVPTVAALVVAAEAIAGALTVVDLAAGRSGRRGARCMAGVFACLLAYAAWMWASGRGAGVGCGCGLRASSRGASWAWITTQDIGLLGAALFALGVLPAGASVGRGAARPRRPRMRGRPPQGGAGQCSPDGA